MSVCCDGLCFDCVLVRCWAITGTLDPVRNLAGLTVLYLSQNSIGGMFVRTVVDFAAVVLGWGWYWCWVSRQCRREVSRRRITSLCGAVWMVLGSAAVLMLSQRSAARQPVVCMMTCV